LGERLARYGVAVSAGAVAAVLAQDTVSACVPTSVVSATVNAGSLVAAGKAAATGMISAQVAALGVCPSNT